MAKEISDVRIASGIKPERASIDGRRTRPRGKPVLIQNEVGSYKFVPRPLAESLQKSKAAIVLTPADKDYVEGTKLALGKIEGVKASDAIQMSGKAVSPKAIGTFDADGIVQDASAAHERAAATPTSDDNSFAGKLRNRRVQQ